MESAKPLPAYLLKRYLGWKATDFDENSAWYRRLAEEGQRPRAMVISCCDSRVHITSIFGAETGEFFIHRNIANLIPPYSPNEDFHGTSAAIEYAVKHLKVSNILLVGHSICGGVQGCFDMCTGAAPELEEKSRRKTHSYLFKSTLVVIQFIKELRNFVTIFRICDHNFPEHELSQGRADSLFPITAGHPKLC